MRDHGNNMNMVFYVKKKSKDTKKLIKFIKGNLPDILKRGMIISEIAIVDKEKEKKLSQKGIKKFPSLLCGNNVKKYGNKEIINFLKTTGTNNNLQGYSNVAPGRQEMNYRGSAEVDVDEYLTNEIIPPRDSSGRFIINPEEFGQNNNSDIMHRINDMVSHRRDMANFSHATYPPPNNYQQSNYPANNYQQSNYPPNNYQQSNYPPNNNYMSNNSHDDPIRAINEISNDMGADQDDELMRSMIENTSHSSNF